MISSVFAQTSAAASQSNLMTFAPLVLMFVGLYFIIIRPQMKRQKEHSAMLASMAKGDEIITGGGIVGKITKIDGNYISLEISENIEVKMQKNAVVMVLPKGTIQSL